MKNGPLKKQSKLEIADDLYRFAFTVKKHKFRLANPHLSEAELDQMTAEYLHKSSQAKE